MKTSPLIIDLRSQLPWHRRYISTTTTALLWGVWFLLWRPVMLILGFLGVNNHHIAHQIMILFLTVLEQGVIMLTVCALLLLVWNNFVPFKSFKTIAPKTDIDYAKYFALDIQDLQERRLQKISVVHHNEFGQITHLD